MAIELKPINLADITIGIRGTSPIIMHAWSEKAKASLRLTAAERRKVKKTKRDPKGESDAAEYRTADGKPGLPAMAVKSALISVAHKDIGLEKTLLRKSLYIVCDDPNGVIPFTNKPKRRVREDMVRVGAGATDLRYRPEFTGWEADIVLRINYDALNENDLVNLMNLAGFGSGLGEWRPEKGGDMGRFEINPERKVEIKK